MLTTQSQRSHGTVGDFIGDAIFAFWGAPVPVGPNHAAMACEAALQQQEKLAELREKWKTAGWPQLKVCCFFFVWLDCFSRKLDRFEWASTAESVWREMLDLAHASSLL